MITVIYIPYTFDCLLEFLLKLIIIFFYPRFCDAVIWSKIIVCCKFFWCCVAIRMKSNERLCVDIWAHIYSHRTLVSTKVIVDLFFSSNALIAYTTLKWIITWNVFCCAVGLCSGHRCIQRKKWVQNTLFRFHFLNMQTSESKRDTRIKSCALFYNKFRACAVILLWLCHCHFSTKKCTYSDDNSSFVFSHVSVNFLLIDTPLSY